MKIYELKSTSQKAVVPKWHFDKATIRQLKVLQFFDVDISRPKTKGVCSGIITRLFSDPSKKHLWAAYVYTTGDEDSVCAAIQPHDKKVLANTEIPADWRPKRGPQVSGKALQALEQLVAEVLKDGSPFDDPVPEINIAGSSFCFTGKFEFGTRKACQAAVVLRSGETTDGITSTTDILVIGNDPNPNWSHGSYGNKIFHAMALKLHCQKPVIISELYWSTLFDKTSVSAQEGGTDPSTGSG